MEVKGLTEKHRKHLEQLKVDITHDYEMSDNDSFKYDRGELRGYLDCLEDSGFITRDEKYELMRYYSSRQERSNN